MLVGNAGSNTLTGDAGADVLHGAGGDDSLRGGMGNDTYLFNRGHGQDTIIDTDTTAGNTDTVVFDVSPLELVFSRASKNLVMSLHGSSDGATVSSWYNGNRYQAEVIQVADGSTLLNTQVDQLIQAMATFSAANGGISWDQAITDRPDEVQAIITAYWQPVTGG